MDLTSVFKILGWFNPRKWLTMFSKWWLKTESLEKERQYILKSKELEIEEQKLEQAKLEANRKKPTWCHVCDTNMVIDEINSAWGKVIGFKYPKCGLEKVHNNKAN